jgi:hypothetical protein
MTFSRDCGSASLAKRGGQIVKCQFWVTRRLDATPVSRSSTVGVGDRGDAIPCIKAIEIHKLILEQLSVETH